MQTVLPIVMILLCIGAVVYYFKYYVPKRNSQSKRRILGSGNVITKEFALPTKYLLKNPIEAFDGLIVNAPIDVLVELSPDGSTSAKITGDDNLLDYFTTGVLGITHGGTKVYHMLTIGSHHDVSWESREDIHITLYLPADTLNILVNEGSGSIRLESQTAIHDVRLFGSGSIYLKNLVVPKNRNTEDLDNDPVYKVHVQSKGSGEIAIVNVIADDLTLDSQGSGGISILEVKLTGDCVVEPSGSGKIQMDKITCENLLLTKGGSGTVFVKSVSARKEAQITAKGSGNVDISVSCDTPNLTIDASGSGDITMKELIATAVNSKQSGSGSIRYECLTAKHFVSTQKGSGDLEITYIETDTLVVNNIGSGDSIFTGMVQNQSVQHTGSGSIDFTRKEKVS